MVRIDIQGALAVVPWMLMMAGTAGDDIRRPISARRPGDLILVGSMSARHSKNWRICTRDSSSVPQPGSNSCPCPVLNAVGTAGRCLDSAPAVVAGALVPAGQSPAAWWAAGPRSLGGVMGGVEEGC